MVTKRLLGVVSVMVVVMLTSLLVMALPASALTQPMVTIATGENVINQEDPDYIIVFSLGIELEAGDTITITFPEDTVVATPTASIAASQGWVGGTWTDAVVTNVSWAGNAILRTITATLGTGDQIGESASVRIEITDGLTNPSSPGDYTLTVKTSDEPTAVTSNTYFIAVGWVSTNDATDISNNSATLHGTLDSLGGYTIIRVSFVWGTTSGGPYPNETGLQEMTSIGPFSAGIDGLSPNTTYYFRAKATNSLTDYGGELKFHTRTQPTVSIAVGHNTVSMVDPDYIIIFTLGKDLEAGDTITITFPEDTIVATPNASIAASPGWVGGNWTDAVVTNVSWAGNAILRTITATLGTGDQIGESASVLIKITAGLTNPSSPGDYTLTVATSDEPTAVTSTIYSITLPIMVPTITLWGGLAMVVVFGLLVVFIVRRRQTTPNG